MKHRLFSDNRWLHIDEFSERYGVNKDIIYQNRYFGRYPKEVVVEGFLDTHYFFKRLELRERIRHEAHDLYYVLRRYWTTTQIAYMLSRVYQETSQSTWNAYMAHELFSEPNRSLTMLKTPIRLWTFWRFARSLVRWALSKRGVNYFKVDINDIHKLDDTKETK